MKSKITKIQILKKGMATLLVLMFILSPIAYATTSLDDSYLEGSLLDKILYGKIGSTAKEIEEWFVDHTTLYITNETQLRALAEYVNNGNDCEGKEIILLNDIEVDRENEWVPIGNIDNPFSGTFNGKKNIISGIRIVQDEYDAVTDVSNVGLFGYVDNGTITRVNFNDIKIDAKIGVNIGSLVGYLKSGNISLCDFIFEESDVVLGSYEILGSRNVGGIVGKAEESIIDSCNNDNFGIWSDNNYSMTYVGGIVGYTENTEIKNCSSASNPRLYNSDYVGGIVGYASNAEIDNCITRGRLSAGYVVGGIVGWLRGTSTVKNCSNDSVNTVSHGSNDVVAYAAGGIVGEADNEESEKIIIINSLNKSGVYSKNNNEDDSVSLGGIVGSCSANIEIENCLNEGNVISLSDINSENEHEGGIIGDSGENSTAPSKGTIKNCVSSVEGLNVIGDNNSNIKIQNGSINSDILGANISVDQGVIESTLGAANILYTIQKYNATSEEYEPVNLKEYFKAGDKIRVVANFDKHLATYYGPLTDISIDTAPVLKLNDEIEMTIEDIDLESIEYSTTIFYDYTVEDGKNFNVETLNLYNSNSDPLYLIAANDYATNANSRTTVDKDEESEARVSTEIKIDTTKPTINTKVYVENVLETERYTAGKEILFEITTSEYINGFYEVPEVQVSFSESGIGKYNYDKESGKVGYAKCIEAKINFDGTTTWVYSYQVQEFDEGYVNIEYKAGEITDLAGNSTNLSEKYKPEQADKTNLKQDGITITKVEILKEDKQTLVDANEYISGKIYVRVYVDPINLYSDINTKMDRETAPDLYLNGTIKQNNITNIDFTNSYIEYEFNTENITKLVEVSMVSLINKVDLYTEDQLVSNAIPVGAQTDYEIDKFYIDNIGFVTKESVIYADTTAPTVTITPDVENSLTNKDSIKYTFKFSEPIKEFSAEDITVINGKIEGDLVRIGNEYQKIIQNGDYNKDGKINSEDAEDLLYATFFDEKEVDLKYDFNADGEVTDWDAVLLKRYTVWGALSNDEEVIFEAEIKPSIENGNIRDLQVIIEENACQDLVALGNVRTESVIRVDKKAPALQTLEAFTKSDIKLNSEVDVVKEYYKTGEEITVVATFDENISAEKVPELVLQFSESKNSIVLNGTIESNKITYTYTIFEGDEGTVSVRAFNGAVTDAAGNSTNVTRKALDGNTIIVDTKVPSLEAINVTSTKTSNKAGETITIEAIYNEPVYVLTTKEDGTKEIVNIEKATEENSSVLAPILKITFDGKDAKGEVKFDGYGQTEGKEDKTKLVYTYTVVGEEVKEDEVIEGDNGKLGIKEFVNSENGQVCDIAGNTSENKAKDIDTKETKADTIAPKVDTITADVPNATVSGTGKFYKAGNTIEIIVKYTEPVHEKILDTIKVAFSDETPEEDDYKDVSIIEWKEGIDTIKYTYEIKDGDNGYLYVKVPDGVCKDAAGNENIGKAGEKITTEEIYADTINPDININTDITITQDENNGQIIRVEAKFNEEVFDLINNNISELKPKEAPEILYGFVGTTDIKTRAAKEVNGDTIVYEIEKEDTISGDFYAAYFKGNLYDRAGNEFYKVGIDTTAPVLKSVEITSNAGISYAPYCREGKEIYAIATFDEPIKAENMKLKAKVGEVELSELLDGVIVEENETKVKFTYTVKAGDMGEFKILDICGEEDDKITEENADNTYGWVEDEYGNKNKIYSFSDEGVTPIGEAEADTKDPYITSIKAKVDGETIATYTREDGKDAVITVGRTNADIVEYIVTYSESINILDKSNIELKNGIIKSIEYTDPLAKDEYKITVQTTVEGVQSLIINEGTVEDKAGNIDGFVRFNAVTTDFTMPTVRFISEYNGGVYVLPTNINKVEIRPNVEISEDIAKIEYSWDNDEDEKYVEIDNYSSSSDIAIPTKAFTEAGTYVLYIKVTDLAGNVTKASKTYEVVNSNIDIELSTYEYTRENIIVTVTFDEGATEDKYKVLTDNRKVTFKAKGSNEAVELNAIGTDEDGNTQYEIEENGTIYAEATDRIENKVFTEYEVTNIDKEYPEIEIELGGANLVIGTDKDKATIKTNVEVSDNVGVVMAKYKFLQEAIDVTELQNMTIDEQKEFFSKIDNELEGIVQIEVPSTKDKPYYLYVVAVDEAKNARVYRTDIFTVVDTNPSEKITTVEGENGPEEIKEIIPAEKPVDQLIIFEKMDEDEKDKAYVNIRYDDSIIVESEVTLADRDYGFVSEYDSVELYGNTKIIVKAWDACGNEVTREYPVTDIVGPEFTITGNPEVWTNGDVELEVYSNTELKELTKNGENILGDNKYKVNTDITEYGSYTFEATDIYNNTSKQTIEVKIDKSAPEITNVEIKDGKIVITANDIDKTLNKELSGLAEYAITDTTEVPLEWSTSNVINVTKDDNFFVWVKDNAGNITPPKEEVVVRDITAPELTVTTDIELDKWTNENIKVEVKSNEELSSLVVKYQETVEQEGQMIKEEREVDILNTKTYTITSNGTYEVIGTDKSGNPTKETITVSKIDKESPVISKVENVGKDITITATDEISGVKEYAITDTTEEPVEWSESNVIKVTEDGKFYAWVKDNAGNISIAATKDENGNITVTEVIVDTTAPTITFNYLSQTVTVGMPVEANVVTNEDAIISYSWDKETWVNSEELITSLTVSEKTTTPGKYTLYVKAIDEAGNESKVQALEFEATTIEEIKQPDIIFEDIPTVQVNGARYVKVSSQMTLELLTDAMNKEALCGKTPEYINLTEDGKLRTGSEITINGKTKYIVVVNGDVDGDGKVTFLGDIVKANDCRIGIGELTTIQMLAADINNNGKIEFISDIVAMNDYRLGIINSL